MTCEKCGSEMVTRTEVYRYKESGLPNVYLTGIKVSRCSSCHNYWVSIPRLSQLHRVMAYAVAAKQSRLTGDEIRFLRKYLGWSGVDFSKMMGTNASTVSRWESGKQRMGPQVERLLRLAAVHLEPAKVYPLELLADVAKGKPRQIRLGLRPSSTGWVEEASP